MLKKLILIVSLALLFGGCSSQDMGKTEYFKQGLSFLKSGNSSGAILSFKHAIEQDENYFEARYQLALAYISQNKYDSAEKELKKALMLNPSFNEASATGLPQPSPRLASAGMPLRSSSE